MLRSMVKARLRFRLLVVAIAVWRYAARSGVASVE
jgi:hypothetical protein